MVNTSWKNEIKYPEHPCKYCGATGWGIGHYVDAGGNPKYPFYCLNCGKRIPGFAKRRVVEKSNVQIKQLYPLLLPFICEVCGAEGGENHHWAPFHLFGDEAEKWPQSFLCPACHKRWHDLVTPNSNGTRKA